MNELIKFHYDLSEKFPIDARELHEFLGSRQRFADWIKNKMLLNPFFEEHQDYIVFQDSMKNPANKGGRPRIDYGLTLDTAKKVSMAEQTTRGNEARVYFLDCERRAKESRPTDQLEILASTVNNLIEQRNRLLMIDKKTDIAVEKIKNLEHRMNTNGCSPGFIPMRVARRKFGSGLSDALFRQVMEHCNVAHQTYNFNTAEGIMAFGSSVDEVDAARAMKTFIPTCCVPEGQMMAKSEWFGEKRFKIKR